MSVVSHIYMVITSNEQLSTAQKKVMRHCVTQSLQAPRNNSSCSPTCPIHMWGNTFVLHAYSRCGVSLDSTSCRMCNIPTRGSPRLSTPDMLRPDFRIAKPPSKAAKEPCSNAHRCPQLVPAAPGFFKMLPDATRTSRCLKMSADAPS